MKKKIFLTLLVILILAISIFFLFVPGLVERGLNQTLVKPPYQAGEQARQLHAKLIVADLHADSLLWQRNLLERSEQGHVDIPRLIEGNVALQAFTIVTKSPRGLNIENNDDRSDNITLLALAQRWPAATWSSLKSRALFQAETLHNYAAASGGKLTIIKTASDLNAYLEKRKSTTGITAGFLGIEGAHAIDRELASVEQLFNAGVRMMAPTHFFDNEVGGSAHGINKGGLTPLGREVIKKMESLNFIVDLAHASPQVIDEVLAMATRPVLVSHTGVKATCDNRRNLSDDQIKKIAAQGGIIGIGFWDTAVCGQDAAAIARAIRHVVNLVGIDYVALGSDYDGSVVVPFDTTGVVLITEALLAERFTENEIEKIMGGNVIRFLQENLPK